MGGREGGRKERGPGRLNCREGECEREEVRERWIGKTRENEDEGVIKNLSACVCV